MYSRLNHSLARILFESDFELKFNMANDYDNCKELNLNIKELKFNKANDHEGTMIMTIARN